MRPLCGIRAQKATLIYKNRVTAQIGRRNTPPFPVPAQKNWRLAAKRKRWLKSISTVCTTRLSRSATAPRHHAPANVVPASCIVHDDTNTLYTRRCQRGALPLIRPWLLIAPFHTDTAQVARKSEGKHTNFFRQLHGICEQNVQFG